MKIMIASVGEERVEKLFPKEKRWGRVVVGFRYSSSTEKQLFLWLYWNFSNSKNLQISR